MNANPFAPSESFLQAPLPDEMFQRIHALALHKAVQGYVLLSAVPQHIHVGSLKQLIERNGQDMCLRHPADVVRIFTGMTLAVYRAIETLYCSRIGRSIPMVWRVLTAMAQLIGAAPVSYEAVWAICVYLDEQRRASTDVSIERGHEDWWLGKITLDLIIQAPDGGVREHPDVVCVVSPVQQRVLSFQLAPEETFEQQVLLALYEAFLLLRRPHQRALAGVLWHLPKRIIAEVPLTADGQAACRRLGISIDAASGADPFLRVIQSSWVTSLAGQVLHTNQCMVLLDRVLDRTYGHGPLRVQAQHDREYAHLAGYRQEPDLLFPLLRAFLPEHAGSISHEGLIEYDNLHYTDDLLPYFIELPVTVRRSSDAEAHLWVYLGKEILCQAMARELRRRDGTYRRSRPGR